MVIRCPHCQFSRSITLDKIPATAEIATCPKCKQRFRFRTLPKKPAPDTRQAPDSHAQPHDTAPKQAEEQTTGRAQDYDSTPSSDTHSRDTIRQPPKKDIWDALSSFGKRLGKGETTKPSSPQASTDHIFSSAAPETSPETAEEPTPHPLREDMGNQNTRAEFDQEATAPPYPTEVDDGSFRTRLPHDTSTDTATRDNSPSQRIPQIQSPKPDEDVEIYIHYVDGKPTSFRNPWAKKSSPQEEAVAESAPVIDTPAMEDTYAGAPAQSFHETSPDSAAVYDEAQAGSVQATPFSGKTDSGQELFGAEGKAVYHGPDEQNQPSDSADVSQDNAFNASSRAQEHSDPRQQEPYGAQADKKERILTPLEIIAAQGIPIDAPDAFPDSPTEGAQPDTEDPLEPSLAKSKTSIFPQDAGPSQEQERPKHLEMAEEIAEEQVEEPQLSSAEEPDEQSAEAPPAKPVPSLPDIASLYEANKPFDYDDTPPEQRVEKDLLLLQTTLERPTKDLGIIREVQHENILYPFTETREIPWEHPKTYGVFSSLLRTIKNVMFSAPAFFRTMPPAGGMPFAFLFFILHGYLAVMCTTFWILLAAFLFDLPALAAIQDAVPSIALFTPVGLSLLLIAATSCTRIFLMLFQRQQATFAFTFKLLSYAIAPLVLSVIPFIGPVAGLIWSFLILGTACHHSTGLSPLRSVITVIPTGLLVLGLFYLIL